MRIMVLVMAVMFILITIISSLSVSAATTEKSITSESGTEVYIDDRADLLTDAEEMKLQDIMMKSAVYGNMMFMTVDQNEVSTGYLAMDTLNGRYGLHVSGAIFLIDMDNREIYLFTDGAINKAVGKSYANSITDDVYQYASSGDYYECAERAFEELYQLLSVKRLPQPMKLICSILIALELGILITFFALVWSRKKTIAGRAYEGKHIRAAMKSNVLIRTRQYYVSSSSGSGHHHSSSHHSSSHHLGGGGGGRHSGSGGGHGF